MLWQVVMPSSKIESTQRYLKMGQPWPPFVLCTGECTSIGITTNLLGLHMQELAKGVDLIKARDQALERVAEINQLAGRVVKEARAADLIKEKDLELAKAVDLFKARDQELAKEADPIKARVH